MADENENTGGTGKGKGAKRAAPKPRPLFILMTVKDEAGNTVKLDKDQIDIVACSRNAAEVLEQLDGGEHENVVYKKFLAD